MIEKIKLFLPCKSAEYIGQKGKQGGPKIQEKILQNRSQKNDATEQVILQNSLWNPTAGTGELHHPLYRHQLLCLQKSRSQAPHRLRPNTLAEGESTIHYETIQSKTPIQQIKKLEMVRGAMAKTNTEYY